MASTVFTDNATVIISAWLNDVNTNTYGVGTSLTGLPLVANASGSLATYQALGVLGGGTGATTATGARTNLGAAASGSNTDITSLNAPALGAATATTQTLGDNSTKVATTAFVTTAVGTSSQSIQGASKNLQASATGLSANISVTADEIVVENSSNAYQTLRSVSLTIAGTSVGANALDTGTIAVSTWYSIWVIYNGTTTAGLMSLSATAPTLPGGYTHKARVGWIRTDASGNKYPLAFKQLKDVVQLVVAAATNVAALPIMSSGVQGSPTAGTYVSVAWSTFFPSTAASLNIVMKVTNGSAIAAPNNSYGTNSSTTNPPPYMTGSNLSAVSNISVVPESSNIYWASDAAANLLQSQGWRDNL